MDDVLVDVLGHKLSEEQLLLWLGGKIVSLRGEVMTVLSCHEMEVVLLDVLNDL